MVHRPSTPAPIVLTVAGSDSGGGAGIQADLRVFGRLGVFGATVITAITAQNERAVRRVGEVEPDLVRAQIDAVVAQRKPAAVKSGMLANEAIVRTLADAIRTHALAPYVLDPVMLATSGAILLAADAVPSLMNELVPLAALVTPNLMEAATLVGHPVTDVAGMEHAARLLVERGGARAALITGGHLEGPVVVDVLYDGSSAPRQFRHRRVATNHTHGTGCTLSAAIAAHLARGVNLPLAVEASIRYVRRELRREGSTRPPLERRTSPHA